jgi:melibiose permease/lactose/raffinose/galactose permease
MHGKLAKRDLTAGTFSGNHVPSMTKWIYSMSGIFRDACYALVSGSFFTYAQTAGLLGTGETYTKQINVITILFVICLIWDGLNDPIMGLIIEKCHFRTGKFRPWILIGAIGTTLMVLLMFLAKPSGWWFVVCFGVFYFLWDFVFTMNDIGYWSMLPSLTNDEKERNKLTSLVTIATTFGSTAMYVCTGLLVHGYDNSYIFGYFAIPVTILFLLSQAAVFFFCKEHKRDPKQEEVSDKTRLGDLFRIFKKNKPLRMVVISIFAYYTLGSILGGFGYTYFYFTYGYGGSKGGQAGTYFLAVYIVSCLISQILYPWIAKKMKQMTIVKVSFYTALTSFVVFFLLGAPIFGEHPLAYSDMGSSGVFNPFNGTGWLILIPVVFFSSSIGIFYLVLLVMMQNSIDYNEWKYGERKEAVAFAWRPLDTKLSNALERGLYTLAIVTTGTSVVYDTINNENSKLARLSGLTAEEYETAQAAAEEAINDSIFGTNGSGGLTSNQKMGYVLWMVISILICLVLAYTVIRFGYHLNEEEHDKIMCDLDERHLKDEQMALQNKAGDAQVELANTKL